MSEGDPVDPGFGLSLLPHDPWILGVVVFLLGIAGVPMSPLWGFLGYRLGLVQGVGVGWSAAVLAAGVQFQLLRALGSRLPGWKKMIHHEGKGLQRLLRLRADVTGLILARLAWAVPFVAVNAWASASPMKIRVFLLVSALAILPNILGLVAIGASVANLGTEGGQSPWSLLGLLGSLSGLGLIVLLTARLVR